MCESGESNKLSEREKSLLESNQSLKAQLKELETTFNQMQSDFSRSIKMREKLDSLCKELQKQTQELKDESHTQIGQAEGQGNKLAKEVSENMEMMENVNKQLSDIMDQSLKVKKENMGLTQQVAEMKQEYDDRHEIMTTELKAASDELVKTRTEAAELRLKTAQDREAAYAEMHKLATLLVDNREQMKIAKDMEVELREKLKTYDGKFQGLQTSLQATDAGYKTFTGEMDKVSQITKDLDDDTKEWQIKWEKNNAELMDITKNHEAVQLDVAKVHESLMKMTRLYSNLEKEKTELLKKLGRERNPPNNANAEKPKS